MSIIKREFRRSYKERFGEEWLENYERKLKSTYHQYLRVNTLKITPEKLYLILEKKGIRLRKTDIDFLFKIIGEDEFKLSSTIEYLNGFFYFQDIASVKSIIALDVKKEDFILDACSAPGGKSTLISQLMNNKGKIISVDSEINRLKAQFFNIQRLGCINLVSYNLDINKIKNLGFKFDKIILDAPCSASGTIWRYKKIAKKINKNKVKVFSNIQKELFKSCLNVLNKNGTIIYSTCSIENEENEENVKWFIKNFNIKLIEQKYFFPHIDNSIGFFYAKFIKN